MSIEARVIQGLVDRGLPLHVAQGIGGNMAVESMFNPGINEINPVVPGSRGGFGLNQWTGPRRRAFEAYAQQRGLPLDDIDLQLDYTLEELRTTERSAYDQLMKTANAEEAARVYSDRFLRPGIPHMDRRIAAARRLAGIAEQSGPRMQEGYQTAGAPQGQPSDFARGYQPAQDMQALYGGAGPQIDPMSLYDPYAIAQRFGVSS